MVVFISEFEGRFLVLERRGVMKKIVNNDKEIREKILNSARMAFDEQGFDNTTLEQVICDSSIPKQVFLSYYQSLDTILEIVWSE